MHSVSPHYIDEEAARQGICLYPAPTHPLHLQPPQLVLVQEGEGAVVRVLPAPGNMGRYVDRQILRQCYLIMDGFLASWSDIGG